MSVTPIERAPRCLRLVEHSSGIKVRPPERCPNEQLPGSALCAAHLAEAAEEYRRITEEYYQRTHGREASE